MTDYTNYGAIERARFGNGGGGNGASALGFILGGGGRMRTQQIANQAALEHGKLEDVLAQAQQRQRDETYKQSQRDARERVASAQEKEHPGFGDFFRGYDNPEQIAKSQIDLARLRYLNQAGDAASGQDDAALNRMLAVFHGQPMTTADIKEGMTFNPHGVAGPVGTTDLGRAMIGADNARAADSYAGARAHDAAAAHSTALAGNVKGSATKPLDDKELSMLLGDPLNDEQGNPQLDSQKRPVYIPNRAALNDFTKFAADQNSGLTPKAWADFHNSFGNVRAGDSTGAAPPPPEPSLLSRIFSAGPPQVPQSARKAVRTGTRKDGVKVVQYDDGSVEPAQ